jgi:hypothetical protein
MDTGPCFDFTPSQSYPDPRIEVLDERFLKLRLFSATVEQLVTGLRWAEGPVWFGDGRFLLVSDIPNNRILRWDEANLTVSDFRKPSNNANGNARDRQGRLLTCEHLTRRVTRTEYDGSITVLADRYEGKRLNSPNDIVCASDGAIWFTDPSFGISSHWEGEPAQQELPHAVYRIAPDGKLQQVLDDLQAPNGLAFSPDEKLLYVIESRATPHRKIWAYDARGDGNLATSGWWSMRRGRARWTASRSTFRATSGAAGAVTARWMRTRKRWTACAYSRPTARPSATSICPSAAPMSASVGGSAIACSWRRATRCTRST